MPITGENAGAPFGPDRVFVAITLGDDAPDAATVARARASGAPFAEWRMPSAPSLGAEFYRWEVATAAAGALLGINPFDEPNVSQAKDATGPCSTSTAPSGALPVPEAHGAVDGARFTLSHTAAGVSRRRSAVRSLQRRAAARLRGRCSPIVPPDIEPFDSALRDVRAALAARTGCASMTGTVRATSTPPASSTRAGPTPVCSW